MSETDDIKAQKEQPIIIKKKRGHGRHGAHGGSWKVAYADFVTAMMAFFIVMWILGQSAEIKQLIVNYFQDPGAFNFITGKRTVPVDLNLTPPKQGEGEQEGEGTSKHEFYFVIPPKDTVVNEVTDQIKRQALSDSIKAAQRVAQLAEEFKKYLNEERSRRPELEEILSSIKIEMTKEGLRIELIESQDALFFEVGSAKLSQKAREILIKLAKEIGKLPNLVDIEGHTDSRKYGKQSAYTNWELSADRANSARRILEENGLWEGQVEKVTGFADRKLRNPQNPYDVSNRRVSILIKQLSLKDFMQEKQQ